MDKNYSQLKKSRNVMVGGPKEETIKLLLDYSKALRVIKLSTRQDVELILN